MLKLSAVETFYGNSQALFGVDMELKEGSLVTLMGRNGMGKTTTVRSILGMTRPRSGSIVFRGAEILGLPSYRIGKAGIGLVPEGRQIFPTLTVRENLIATAANRSGSKSPWTLDKVYDRMPRLRERSGQLGSTLSGGEQQMLAIGRALMTNPYLLILDEATEGLAPLIRAEIWATLAELKEGGQTTLVIDKNLDEVARVADHCYVMEKGLIVWDGTVADMKRVEGFANRYLGV